MGRRPPPTPTAHALRTVDRIQELIPPRHRALAGATCEALAYVDVKAESDTVRRLAADPALADEVRSLS